MCVCKLVSFSPAEGRRKRRKGGRERGKEEEREGGGRRLGMAKSEGPSI